MKFVLNIILVLLISCSPEPRHVQLVDKEIGLFSKKMSKYGLFLGGSGGALNKNIKIFTMSFRTQKKVDLTEARKLFVSMAESFLNLANSNEEIRPFLHSYPLTIKNLGLSISFYDSDNKRVSSPYIAYIYVPNMNPNKPIERVYYDVYNPITNSLNDFHEETYEEALNIVKSQNGLQLY